MPEDGELQRGRERLERYAKDPYLAELLERAAPPVARGAPTLGDLANLARLVEYVFGPRHPLSEPELTQALEHAPSSPSDLASFLAAVVPAVSAGSTVGHAAIVWRLRQLHRQRVARAASPAEAWARQFTRGPAFPQ